MNLLAVTRQPDGSRRVHVLGLRIHHGAAGLLCALPCLRAMWSDRRDARQWFRLHDGSRR